MHPRPRPGRLLAATAVALVGACLAAACSTGDDWSRPHAAPVAVGALGAGFLEPDSTPSPEATITPRSGSWDEVHPSKGYRVVLITAGDDAPTRALVTAVRDWADDEHVDLRTITAADAHDLIPTITEALAMHPDLVVSAGNDLVDPLAVVTANHLDQQFLTIGAEVAEPTHNVTAVDWTGAAYRGEGLESASAYDPATFTADRCAAAVRAGAAAVLTGHTGIVLWID